MIETSNKQKPFALALEAVHMVKTGKGLVNNQLPEYFNSAVLSEGMMLFIEMVSQDYLLASAAQIRELDLGSYENNLLLKQAISSSLSNPFMNN